MEYGVVQGSSIRVTHFFIAINEITNTEKLSTHIYLMI